MTSKINFLLLYILLQLFNYPLKAQDFGCFSAEDKDVYYKQSLPNRREYKTIYNDLFSDYLISSTTDGYCVERFCPYEKIASKVKMEGNIVNGKASGKWTFYKGLYNFCFTGNFIEGKKEGLWIAYFISRFDTNIIFKAPFINNLLNGFYIEYSNGIEIRIIEYKNGVKHGLDVIKYEDGCIRNLVEYKNGLKNGVELYLDNNGDTISYKHFNNDTLHGKSVSFNNSIEYKNGKADGEVLALYDNGKPSYGLIFKNNLPYTCLYAYDSIGNKLNQGTLVNGTGILNCYYENGTLKSSFEYQNQLIVGQIHGYYSDSSEYLKGNVHCQCDKNASIEFNSHHFEDINLFALMQQCFVDSSFVQYKYSNSLYGFKQNKNSDTTFNIAFSNDGNLIYKNQSICNMKIGEEVENFEDGTPKRCGNYVIVNKDGECKSVPNGLFKYYYKNGLIRAEENFSIGEYSGKSSYYDDAGNLIRIYFVAENGSSYNIFEGDTVNRIDSLGQKQGKWIKLWDNVCSKEIASTTYYKNNKPISEIGRNSRFYNLGYYENNWETEDLVKEILYYDSTKKEEGYLYKNERVGKWKEYDFKKGYLKALGLYFSGERIGKWYFYNKRGRVVYIREYHLNGSNEVIKIKNKRKFKVPETLDF